jgi:hypothetical protein
MYLEKLDPDTADEMYKILKQAKRDEIWEFELVDMAPKHFFNSAFSMTPTRNTNSFRISFRTFGALNAIKLLLVPAKQNSG